MLDVDDAIRIIFEQTTTPLKPKRFTLLDCPGHICAENVYAKEDFPAFPASIMDGYALLGPSEPGKFLVEKRVHAGR